MAQPTHIPALPTADAAVLDDDLRGGYAKCVEKPDRQRTLLDFAWKLTLSPHDVGDDACVELAAAGLAAADIFDLAETFAFFNLSNRVACTLDMMPNPEYHRRDR